jgi:hypothetical protein
VTPNPSTQAASLREMALSLPASDIGATEIPNGARVFGVLMESRIGDAVVTLVCFVDGTTSLYFSGGGGVIGAGQHESVRAAATALVALGNHFAPSFTLTTTFPLPAAWRVRFFLRTFDCTKTEEVAESDVTTPRVPLFSLFAAGQRVISAVRELGLV